MHNGGPKDDDYDEIVTDTIAAIQEGNNDAVKHALSGGHLTVNAVDRDGCSLLHWAAINNRSSIVLSMIASGVNINYTGGVLGETALVWALRRKFYHMVYLLKTHGGDLSIKSIQGNDALFIAVKEGTPVCYA